MKTEAEVSRAFSDPQQIWACSYRATDNKLLLVETPLDAIGLEQSRGNQRTCYIATGTRPDEDQKRRIAHVLAELPPGMSVVLDVGRDERGRQLADELRVLAPTVNMEPQMPEFGAPGAPRFNFEQRHSRSISRTSHQLGR